MPPSRLTRHALPIVLCSLLLSGCAVYRALDWGAPDLRVLKTGISRAKVEAQLGNPISRSLAKEDMIVDIYEYERSLNPNVIRAVGHVFMDIFTLGIWEIVVAYNNQEILVTHRLRVVYDEDDAILEVREVESYPSDLTIP